MARADLYLWWTGEVESIFVFYLTGALTLAFFVSVAITRSLRRSTPQVIELLHEDSGQDVMMTYMMAITTSLVPGCGCQDNTKVFMQLYGQHQPSQYFHLRAKNGGKALFLRGYTDIFLFKVPERIGEIKQAKLVVSGLDGPLKWCVTGVELYHPASRSRCGLPMSIMAAEILSSHTTKDVVKHKSACSFFWKSLIVYHQWLALIGNAVRFGAFTELVHVILVFTALITLLTLTQILYIVLPRGQGQTNDEFDLDMISLLIGSCSASGCCFFFILISEICIRNVKSVDDSPGNAYKTVHSENTTHRPAEDITRASKEMNNDNRISNMFLLNANDLSSELQRCGKLNKSGKASKQHLPIPCYVGRLLANLQLEKEKEIETPVKDLEKHKSELVFLDEVASVVNNATEEEEVFHEIIMPRFSSFSLSRLLSRNPSLDMAINDSIDFENETEDKKRKLFDSRLESRQNSSSIRQLQGRQDSVEEMKINFPAGETVSTYLIDMAESERDVSSIRNTLPHRGKSLKRHKIVDDSIELQISKHKDHNTTESKNKHVEKQTEHQANFAAHSILVRDSVKKDGASEHVTIDDVHQQSIKKDGASEHVTIDDVHQQSIKKDGASEHVTIDDVHQQSIKKDGASKHVTIDDVHQQSIHRGHKEVKGRKGHRKEVKGHAVSSNTSGAIGSLQKDVMRKLQRKQKTPNTSSNSRGSNVANIPTTSKQQGYDNNNSNSHSTASPHYTQGEHEPSNTPENNAANVSITSNQEGSGRLLEERATCGDVGEICEQQNGKECDKNQNATDMYNIPVSANRSVRICINGSIRQFMKGKKNLEWQVEEKCWCRMFIQGIYTAIKTFRQQLLCGHCLLSETKTLIVSWTLHLIQKLSTLCNLKLQYTSVEIDDYPEILLLLNHLVFDIILLCLRDIFDVLLCKDTSDLGDMVMQSHNLMSSIEHASHTVIYCLYLTVSVQEHDADISQLLWSLNLHNDLYSVCQMFLQNCFQLAVKYNDLTWAFFKLLLNKPDNQEILQERSKHLEQYVDQHLQTESQENVIVTRLCNTIIHEAKHEVWQQYHQTECMFADIAVKLQILETIKKEIKEFKSRKEIFDKRYDLIPEPPKSRLQKLMEKRKKKDVAVLETTDEVVNSKTKGQRNRRNAVMITVKRKMFIDTKFLNKCSSDLQSYVTLLGDIYTKLKKRWEKLGLKFDMDGHKYLAQSLIHPKVKLYLSDKERTQKGVFTNFLQLKRTEKLLTDFVDQTLEHLSEYLLSDVIQNFSLRQPSPSLSPQMVIEDIVIKSDLLGGLVVDDIEDVLCYILDNEDISAPQLIQMAKSHTYFILKKSSHTLHIISTEVNAKLEPTVSKVVEDQVNNNKDENVAIKLDSINVTQDLVPAVVDPDQIEITINPTAATDTPQNVTIRDLINDLRPLQGFVQYMWRSEKLHNVCTLADYLKTEKCKRDNLCNVTRHNIVDSYYMLEEGDDTHIFTKCGLYQLEYDITRQTDKYLALWVKTFLMTLMLLMIGWGLVYVTLVGGQFSTTQLQEWVCYFLMSVTQYGLVLETIKAYILGCLIKFT